MPNEDYSEYDEPELIWEVVARERVESLMQNLRLDELSGAAYLMSEQDHRRDFVKEVFNNQNELRHRLIEIYNEEWYGAVPFESGEAVFDSDPMGIVEHIIVTHGVEDFFKRMQPPEEGELLIGSKDLIVARGGLIVANDLAEVNEELISYLSKHPEWMHRMEPEKFENLVSEILKAKGYDTEVTKRTRDGGIDIRAMMKSDVGTLLTITQCKRYAPHRKVSVEAVRELYGVVESDRATNGLIVTTSTFTASAKAFQEKNKYRMSLADMNDLKKWLTELKTRKR